MIRTEELLWKACNHLGCSLETKQLGNGTWQVKHRHAGQTHVKAFDPTVDLSPDGWMTPIYSWIAGHHGDA